ncbi:MAG: helicase-related protein, partial [Actinomycetota bacterium]
VSPLKALINDQYGRLDALCEHLNLPVHRWHGDVPGSRKAKVLADPDGVLLITPESLEALLAIHGPKISAIFGGLRYVVIDELHSFLGAERGAQLQSLLHRAELVIRRHVPRVGLSATLGDMTEAASFLRPGHGGQVTIVESADSQELRLQLLGFESSPPVLTPKEADAAEALGAEVAAEDVTTGDRLAVADHLYRVLRGTDNLVFANSRRDVEIYADLLRRRSDRDKVPCEFIPHHGSLSKDLREHAEARLKDRSGPVTAVCTSTLEMGIDIGTVSSIAQIGVPHAVSGLRQRLGRSGRRNEPATLRIYVTQEQIAPQTAPPDALRSQLVQAVAMVNLLLNRWNEAPESGGLHLSTLIQQLLSLLAQHGGAQPAQAFSTLCGPGPFEHVTAAQFTALLRALGAADVIVQSSDGLLLPGTAGERLVNHYSFYAAFRTAQEYRLVTGGRTLGTLPVDYPLMPGSLLIFGGRRWKVVSVDGQAKVVELVRSAGGRPPSFTGTGVEVADRVRREMLTVYTTSDVPGYLDATATTLLAEGRANFAGFGLAGSPVLEWGKDTLVFPWRGDRITSTLAAGLAATGTDVSQDGMCLTMPDTSREEALTRLEALAVITPDPLALAATVRNKVVDKYDDLLSEDLLNAAYAARSLDVPGAWRALTELIS